MTDRTKAERALAFLIHEIRDEWDEHGITATLRKCSDKTLPDTIAAALDCATRRHEQRTPACIALDGEHWRALVNMAGGSTPAESAPLPYYDRTPIRTEPNPVTDVEKIRAIRLAAKAAATTEGASDD